jgi:hypothetical protein
MFEQILKVADSVDRETERRFGFHGHKPDCRVVTHNWAACSCGYDALWQEVCRAHKNRVKTGWRPTHRITMARDGRTFALEVFLYSIYPGGPGHAYTEPEWELDVGASWYRDHAGIWLWKGIPANSDFCSVTVEQIGCQQ